MNHNIITKFSFTGSLNPLSKFKDLVKSSGAESKKTAVDISKIGQVATSEISKTLNPFSHMINAIRGVGAEAKKSTKDVKDLANVGNQKTKSPQAPNKLSSTIGEGLTAGAISAPLVMATKSAIEFEDRMNGIAKQVAGARDVNGELTQSYYDMRKQIQDLASVSPISPNDIADIVTAGARMGVAKEQLIDFTKLSIKMGTAFEAPASEIADQMGKIANVFGIPIAKTEDLAGAINYLDDNAISKGSDIINVLQRVGGSAKAVGISAQDVTALGSTFLSMGKPAEVAGTAINSLITTLSTLDVKNKGTGEAFKKLGLNVADIKTSFGKDAQGTITTLFTALGKLDSTARIDVSSTIFGRNFGDDIVTVAGSMGEYNRQLGLANSQVAKSSLNAEYQSRLKLTSAKIEIMKNQFSNLAVNIGSVVIPVLAKFLDILSPIVAGVADFASKHKTLTTILVVVAGVLATVLAVMSSIGIAVLVVTPAITALGVVFGLMSLPILAVVTAVGALAAAVYLIYDNWSGITKFFSGLWDSVKAIFNEFINWVSVALEPVFKAIDMTKSAVNAVGSALGFGDTKQVNNYAQVAQPQPINNTGIKNNNTQNVTMNITGDNPQAIAKEVNQGLGDINKQIKFGNAMARVAL